ncbi:MAG: Stp1/IreP family PP2C-type Ser/Thr phosphatase [Thermoanaerobaculia bacterium]|nr:Stp1/IreP family PP2C-type Ser/Thr phosphatase [Thermoanaerobaculia bacterium]
MTDSSPGRRLAVAAHFRTDVGCTREINEDSIAFFDADGSSARSAGVVAVVADGMGGHSAGEVASRIATDTVGSVYFDTDGDPRTALLRAFAEANRRIYDAAQASPDREGMGTTCTALALRDGRAWAVHVGDSRIYLLRGGELYRMTEDDSVVGDMVRKGLISSEEARHHADKNVILRALGTRPEVETSAWEKPFQLRAGDRFVLSTDGLHDLVSDAELRDALLGAEPAAACAGLVELAKKHGGYDNITVGIVAIDGCD